MKVNTDELNRQASELRQIAGRLNDIQDSVLRITRNLCRESVGERFRFPLMDAARAIGNRSEDMRKLRTALNQIARTYEGTEVRILDEADHAAVHHESHNIGPIPIPGIIHDIIPIEPIRPIGPDGILRILPEGETIRDVLQDVLDRWQNQEAIDYQRNWHRDYWQNRDFPQNIDPEILRDVFTTRDTNQDIRDFWNESRRNIIRDFPNGAPDAVIRDVTENNGTIQDIRDFWNESRRNIIRDFPNGAPDAVIRDVIDNNSTIQDIRDFWNESRQNIIRDLPNVNPGEVLQPDSISDIINTIGEAVQEAFGDNPSDTIGTGAIPEAARQILDTIDGGIQQVAEGIGDLFEGGSAIDWTPWNP